VYSKTNDIESYSLCGKELPDEQHSRASTINLLTYISDSQRGPRGPPVFHLEF